MSVQNHPKDIQKSSQSHPKYIPELLQSHPKVIPKSSQRHPIANFSIRALPASEMGSKLRKENLRAKY
jgi:hypothetical protein